MPAWTFTITGTRPTPSVKPLLRSILQGAGGDNVPTLTSATVITDAGDGSDPSTEDLLAGISDGDF